MSSDDQFQSQARPEPEPQQQSEPEPHYRIFVWRKKGSVAEKSTQDDRIKYADLEAEVLMQGQQALDLALGILPNMNNQTRDFHQRNKREQCDNMLQQRHMLPGVAGNPFFQTDCYLQALDTTGAAIGAR
jgi:hypothetical protein